MTVLEQRLQLADQGDAEAQYKLGMMYENGIGVDKNLAEAFFWYWLSAIKPALERANAVGKRLTHEQVNEAQKRVKEWEQAHAAPAPK